MNIDYKLLGKNAGMVAKQIVIKGTTAVAFDALVYTFTHTLNAKQENGTKVKESLKNIKVKDVLGK